MRVLASLFILFIGFGVVAQTVDAETDQSGPKITFAEPAHDFGDITQGDVVTHVFKYENTGNEALVISNVRTSCGCTAPDWDREPLAPGATTEMSIKFNSRGKIGIQNKIITITSNAVNSTERIKIKANVMAVKTETEDGK